MWPVAVPAWPLAFVVLLLGCLALAVFARIERFWNQPRQYRVRYNTYGYDVRSRGFEIRLKTAPPPQPHIGDEVETVTRRTMMMS